MFTASGATIREEQESETETRAILTQLTVGHPLFHTGSTRTGFGLNNFVGHISSMTGTRCFGFIRLTISNSNKKFRLVFTIVMAFTKMSFKSARTFSGAIAFRVLLWFLSSDLLNRKHVLHKYRYSSCPLTIDSHRMMSEL